MQQYLNDIEYAATTTIHAIWQEQEAISKLDKEIIRLVKIAEDKYRRADNLQQSEDVTLPKNRTDYCIELSK